MTRAYAVYVATIYILVLVLNNITTINFHPETVAITLILTGHILDPKE